MTRIPADYREFVRVSVDLPANPKLALIDNPAAGWAYVVSLCYCGQHLTDGSFPMSPLLRLAGVKPAVAKALIGAGLWHEHGHTCDRCPQPMSGTGIVHDYLVHQRSSGEAKALRDARREAGRKGAASRWDGNGAGNSHSNGHSKSHANSEASDMADASQVDDRAMPEVEVEEEKELLFTAVASNVTSIDGEFETFWSVWPRKVAKQAALKAYRSARRKKVPADLILTAAQRQIEAWRAERKEKRFIPHGATWLNEARYADEAERPKFHVINNPESPWDGVRVSHSESPWANDMGWTS